MDIRGLGGDFGDPPHLPPSPASVTPRYGVLMSTGERGTDADALVLEDHFAMVPEWLLDAEITDCAVRLYAVLLRYGQSSGARMPARSTLAKRLHKKSTDTVDRSLKELTTIGAVVVEARFSGRERLTNRYLVRTSRPRRSDGTDASPPSVRLPVRGSRKFAATRTEPTSRSNAGSPGRSSAATVAAGMRHNPQFSTENTPPSETTPSTARPSMAEECGIEDWNEFVADCGRRRRAISKSNTRWASHCLDAALQLAVRGRSWPGALAADALLAVAADPDSRSPMRVAEAGPWWDVVPTSSFSPVAREEIEAANAELAEADGLRVALQQRARAELISEGHPCNRSTVLVRAAALLRADAASTTL